MQRYRPSGPAWLNSLVRRDYGATLIQDAIHASAEVGLNDSESLPGLVLCLRVITRPEAIGIKRLAVSALSIFNQIVGHFESTAQQQDRSRSKP